jgi:eukaryotic-like serine/threonine-protein kinase
MTTDLTPTTRPELEPGSTFGPYRIVRLLGRGGMGAVYEAEHSGDGRIVALKLLSVDLDKMDSRERFLREGQSAAAINHPNAVYIYGTEEIDGTPAISMELVPGGTLEDRVKEKGPLPWAEAVEYIINIIDGLDAAHAAGVLHRDVKPANCFIGTDGTVKIGDFGLSKPVGGEEAHKLTQTGLFLGTPVFSSPEQLLGENLDARSDIYAVGVTFYQLLTGKLPYAASGSMMQVVAAVLNGVPQPLSEARPGLPQNVVDVVMKAMARKAADRYQSYDEFRSAVLALRATEAVPATLWDRFRASIVDWVVNSVLTWIIAWAVFRPVLESVATDVKAATWQQTFISLGVALLVVGVPEGLRGASVGKWLIGIRVVRMSGGLPGIPRALMRVMMFGLADMVTAALQSRAGTTNESAGIVLIAMILVRGSFLVTARRSNGWRLLHDVLTGTRVVTTRALAAQRRGETQRVVAPTVSGGEAHVGPYVVLGTMSDGVVRGWDPTMRRHVWIVMHAPNSPELSPARRTLSRLTRLRWVGGRRSHDGDDSWDAFEAPIGEPLSQRLTRPVAWTTERDWLEDVCTELIAEMANGNGVGIRSASELWVTPNDRIVFPELPASGERVSQPPMALIADLIDRVRGSAPTGVPMPAYARRVMTEARTAQHPGAVLEMLRTTIGRPVETTRMRRAGLMLATAAPIFVLTFVGVFSARQAAKFDRDGFLMASLLSFVGDSTRTNRDSVRARTAAAEANPRAPARIVKALERLGFSVISEPDTITPQDTLRRQRRLAEAYLATVLAKRARDTVATTMYGNTPKDQRRRTAILARNKSVDSATARDARRLVDSVWKRRVPGSSPEAVFNLIPLFTAGAMICFGAFVSIVSGLIARRGPLIRGFQLDVVTRDGAPAGRLRILARNATIWFTFVVGIVIYLLSTRVPVSTLASVMIAAAVMSALAWLAGVASNLHTPSRGLSERLTGTWLVPD